MRLPSAAETRRIRKKHRHRMDYMQGRIDAHVLTVRRIAQVIGKRLKKKGHDIDLKAIDTAALLHDMRKKDGRHHPKLAADELRETGYGELADIVETHDTRTLLKRKLDDLSLEQKLLMYADARGSSGWPLSLEERCDEVRRRYKVSERDIDKTFGRLRRFEDWLKEQGVDLSVQLTPKQKEEVERQRARGQPREMRGIDEHVFRSAKPDKPTQMDFLKYKDFSGIVSLDRMTPDMVAKAKSAGMEILDMPWDEECPPEDDEVKAAMGFIDSHVKKGGKVLIHCNEGRQRTGTLAALYRIHRGEHPILAYGKEDYGISQRHKEFILGRGTELVKP